MELGVQRGRSQALPVDTNCVRKRSTFALPRGRLLLYYPAGGRISPCPATAEPIKDWNDSANEKPLHLKLPVFPQGTHNIPLQLLVLSVKVPFFAFVLQTAYDCQSFHVLNCNSLFANKLILLIK